MTAPGFPTSRLLDQLPAVKGGYTGNAPLDKMTRFRVGGPAEVMFRPADEGDLIQFLEIKPVNIPVTVIGAGSNLLVRDGGVAGVVVRLGREFAEVQTLPGGEVRAGAAALNPSVATAARDAGIAGIEFLSSIPGTIGGSLRMNAGSFGVEMKDVVTAARALDDGGGFNDLTPADLGFAYRSCAVPQKWIFLSVLFRGRPGEIADISRRLTEIRNARRMNQPQRASTGGSTFTNPPGGKKAWQLIDEAGCRGLRRGDAVVSEKHCNFLINTYNATAADLEGLGEEVRQRVAAATGVDLEWEIHRIGVAAGEGKS